jgi:DNA excision repair protein ERCC-2
LKPIRISISDFAIPSPLTGSLETYSGLGSSAMGDAKKEGIEIHQRIQRERQEQQPEYQSEVTIRREFELTGYKFLIEGRMDGFLPAEKPLIEEIKSTFNIWELAKHLRVNKDTHPYCLQLQTYGYFHWLETGIKPDLNLLLVSTRNHETLDFDLQLNIGKYEAWLQRRLEEICQEVIRAEKRTKRRKELSKKLVFPFEKPRHGQVELIQTIEKSFNENKFLMLQAPTGLGKTIGVLYPALKEALGRGQKVVYLTPKNSQHTVAEEALDKLEEKGSSVKSLTLTAKSKMCFKAEPLCNPEYCEFAKDYYDKLAKNDLKAQLAKKRKLTSRVFKNMGEKYQVCPFELQLEATDEADTVICDYNYVFGNRSALGRLPRVNHAQEGLSNLVVDEAHNLPARGMSYYSPVLSSFVLEKMREEFKSLPRKFSEEGRELIDDMIAVIKSVAPLNTSKPSHVKLKLEPFLIMDEQVRGFLSRYLETDVEIKPRDVVLRMCFYWNEFTDVLKQIHEWQRPEFFFTYHPDVSGGVVKITCCDAGEMLKEKYQNYQNVVLFSATLKPFDYYLRLSGLNTLKVETHEFLSPFRPENRKVLIIPQISTKFSDRQRNYSRIGESISRITSLKSGNYFAFFPSFDFMEQVFRQFAPAAHFQVLKQERFMKNSDSELLLSRLKHDKKPTIVFGVQGGIFSEGVDYPGDMLIGAFVIGPPLPNFDVERETMREFYHETYREGFEYAYTYPAMAKAVQAAGRVIRTEEDRGIIVLMDSRFLEQSYSKTMPADWYNHHPLELVSHSILSDLQAFWSYQL